LTRLEATDLAFEGACQLGGGSAHRELHVVSKLGDGGRLTLLDARFHDTFGIARGLLDPVFITNMNLDPSDATREVRERMLRPLDDAFVESLVALDVIAGADFDLHAQHISKGNRFVEAISRGLLRSSCGLCGRPRAAGNKTRTMCVWRCGSSEPFDRAAVLWFGHGPRSRFGARLAPPRRVLFPGRRFEDARCNGEECGRLIHRQ